MTTFKQGLIDIVSSRLKALGYEYRDSLQDRSLVFGFEKILGDSVAFQIIFRRQQIEEQPIGYGFTVDLVRRNIREESKDSRYQHPLWAPLGHVLWFVHDIRTSPESYNAGWIPKNQEEFIQMLADAVEKLERYGIPWLENPSSWNLGVIPDDKRDEFNHLLGKMIVPELKGYEFTFYRDNLELPYFVKKLENDSYAFIEFKLIVSRETKNCEFVVLLKRKSGSDPGDYSSGTQLYSTLSMLLREVYGLGHISLTHKWEYRNREELEEQIRSVRDHLKGYGVSWLENPDSRNPFEG